MLLARCPAGTVGGARCLVAQAAQVVPRPAFVGLPRRAAPPAQQQQRRGARATAAAAGPQQDSWAAATDSTSSVDAGDAAAPPVFTERYHSWRWGSRVRYYTAGDSGPVLLLCHGFGVGGYHFDRNFGELSKKFRVFAYDLLGQGDSWPASPTPDPDPELGPLMYSADNWTTQLLEFMTDVIGVTGDQPCYIAGNSLGGYLAVNLAAQRPELVKGLVLLNAAPFWSFRALGPAAIVFERLGLDGAVPVPKTVKSLIERLWWNNLRSPANVQSLLSLVYAKPLDDARLLERVLAAADHPAAIDAFASIVLSPKTKRSFDENIAALACPVMLLYGRDDPWIVPLWGQRFKRSVPHAAYYEIADVGHCPHHEAPNAVNRVLMGWLDAVERRLPPPAASDAAAAAAAASDAAAAVATTGDPLLVDGPLKLGESLAIVERDGSSVVVSHVQGAPRGALERFDAFVWSLKRRFSGKGGDASAQAA